MISFLSLFFFGKKLNDNSSPCLTFSHLFLHKKHQEKITNKCETKWIYIQKGFEDKLYKDLFLQPGTNKTEKLSHWKYVSIIIFLL